jgi:hypothetical protein
MIQLALSLCICKICKIILTTGKSLNFKKNSNKNAFVLCAGVMHDKCIIRGNGNALM